MIPDDLPYYSNIILVSGNGRNVGKTTLCSNIIEHNKSQQIIGVKISPHFHEIDLGNEDVIYQDEGIILIEEHAVHGKNDSSKFKQAGAFRVFFIMVKDENLQQAFTKLLEIIGNENPMIIESAGLRAVIQPAQFLLLSHIDRKTVKESIKPFVRFADHHITLSETFQGFVPENLLYHKGQWIWIESDV